MVEDLRIVIVSGGNHGEGASGNERDDDAQRALDGENHGEFGGQNSL